MEGGGAAMDIAAAPLEAEAKLYKWAIIFVVICICIVILWFIWNSIRDSLTVSPEEQIVKDAQNQPYGPAYYALKIHEAVSGSGTDEAGLENVIKNTTYAFFMQYVNPRYFQAYGEDAIAAINDDISSTYDEYYKPLHKAPTL